MSALEQEVCLRNGLMVSLRSVTGDDEAAIWELLSALSIDSQRLRFFGTATNLRAGSHRSRR